MVTSVKNTFIEVVDEFEDMMHVRPLRRTRSCGDTPDETSSTTASSANFEETGHDSTPVCMPRGRCNSSIATSGRRRHSLDAGETVATTVKNTFVEVLHEITEAAFTMRQLRRNLTEGDRPDEVNPHRFSGGNAETSVQAAPAPIPSSSSSSYPTGPMWQPQQAFVPPQPMPVLLMPMGPMRGMPLMPPVCVPLLPGNPVASAGVFPHIPPAWTQAPSASHQEESTPVKRRSRRRRARRSGQTTPLQAVANQITPEKVHQTDKTPVKAIGASKVTFQVAASSTPPKPGTNPLPVGCIREKKLDSSPLSTTLQQRLDAFRAQGPSGGSLFSFQKMADDGTRKWQHRRSCSLSSSASSSTSSGEESCDEDRARVDKELNARIQKMRKAIAAVGLGQRHP